MFSPSLKRDPWAQEMEGRPIDFSENLRPDNEKEKQARSKKGSVGWDVIVGEYWVNHGILMADNSDYSD